MKKQIFFLATALLFMVGCSEDGQQSSWGTQHNGFAFDNNGDPTIGEQTEASEQYNEIEENAFISVADAPISTFSIDADGAAYANIRRFIGSSILPPKGAIRIEEMINYFPMDYEKNYNEPVVLNGEIADCPWKNGNKLLRIGMQGKEIDKADLPASNLVFLIDVSGSMSAENKLPLLKEGMSALVGELDFEDRLSIVTYASNPGVALHSTSGENKTTILEAIQSLNSGGSTNGAGGIKEAYRIATENFIEGGNNRIILGTDGDFNVGVSSQDELIELIEEMRETGIFLTVVGLGTGNYQEGTMEQLANHGNGTFEYVDNTDQALKVFVHEYHKFYASAKDVKIQIEFKPENVKAYRLIGYENRVLNTEDFEDDTKDAGELSIGQNITAFYEIIPADVQDRAVPATQVDFRFKLPDGVESQLVSEEIFDEETSFSDATEALRFCAGVAGFGMLLFESEHLGTTTYSDVESWINNARTYDPHGYRSELMDLVARAKGL